MIKLVNNRLILSVLCIIIGMVPLIALVNTIQSGNQMLKAEFQHKASMMMSIDLEGSKAVYEDFKNLMAEMPEIGTIIPIAAYNTSLNSYKETAAVRLKAVNSHFLKYAGLKLIRGDFFTRGHLENSPNVIVIDDLTADQLFGTTEVLGQKIDTTIQGMEFEATIIGVCKRLDISEGQLDSEQGFAYVPITMLDNHLADYDMQRMLLTIKDIQIDEAKAKIIHFLKDKGIALHQEDMKLANQVELIDAFAGKNKVIFAALSILWFTLAMISLINIMLVDIERSKTYYGLLKFYGRSESAIRKLVYLKAYATAMACSICSIGLGLATSFAVCYMLHIPIHISIHSISLGLLLPMIICLLSAVYPAWKASSIDMNNAIWRVE